MAALVMAVFWVAMSSHCLIEFVSGLKFLDCEAPHGANSVPGSHCDDDACQTVEAGHYVSSQLPTTPETVGLTILVQPIIRSESAPPVQPSGRSLRLAPPDLAGTWQFNVRAALPVRAPSFAS